MCILILPQISLPRTPSLPGELAVAEVSSLNNTDRKRWSILKSFWSRSTKHDCRVETAKSLEGHSTFSSCYLDRAWLTAKGCGRNSTGSSRGRALPFAAPVAGALETLPPSPVVTTGHIYRPHSYFSMQTCISLRTEDVSSAFTVPLRIYSKLFLGILYN